MSDIFEEVEEAVVQDRLKSIWSKVQWVVYGLIAIIVGGVAFYEFNASNTVRAQEREADAFHAAMLAFEDNDYVAASALFEEILNSDSSFAPLAGHFLSEVRIAGQGDRAAAADALATAAASGDGVIADLALLKAAYIESPNMTLEDLRTKLEPLTSSTSQMSFLANELVAARAYELGNLEEARRIYNTIVLALDAPEATRFRAERAIATLDTLKQLEGSAQ